MKINNKIGRYFQYRLVWKFGADGDSFACREEPDW